MTYNHRCLTPLDNVIKTLYDLKSWLQNCSWLEDCLFDDSTAVNCDRTAFVGLATVLLSPSGVPHDLYLVLIVHIWLTLTLHANLKSFHYWGLPSVINDLARQEVELDIRMLHIITRSREASGLEMRGGRWTRLQESSSTPSSSSSIYISSMQRL